MDVNLELIKRIISSDELCDKVNSGDNREVYKRQIEAYVLKLIDDNPNSNIEFINRYLRKFVLGGNKEDIFFNKVLLRLYSLNINNFDFVSILNSFGYDEIKGLLIKKYNEYIINRSDVSSSVLIRMLSLYCYCCPNYIFPTNYIDYFTYYLYSKKISLDLDLMSYFYRQFALSFAHSKGVNTSFCVMNDVVRDDPYYDNTRSNIIVYKNCIGSNVDCLVLAGIFYQITYLYILNGINSVNNVNYTFEQLELVKEICLSTLLGADYFNINYGDISFTSILKKQSLSTVSSYFSKLGISISIDSDVDDSFVVDCSIQDDTDKAISIDVLFDLTLKHENPNLLSGLVRSYPVLGCEYRNNRKKSLLNLIMDIYNNKKLLGNLNKDLAWYSSRPLDDIVRSKIEKLNDKISVCSSCISVMNSIIMNGDLTSYDLLRSISDLITYNRSNVMIKNDVFLVLKDIIPKKIKKLCVDREVSYRENLKKKVIKCYMDSLSLVKKDDVEYFMKIYSTLELCISAFNVD